MSLEDALDLCAPNVAGARFATGTDGKRWYWAWRHGPDEGIAEGDGPGDKPNSRKLRREQVPAGVDWVPGILPKSQPWGIR